jgi:chitinase
VAATDVPKAIPDNNPAGGTSTLTLAGAANVANLTVTVNITTTFDSDLRGTLTSPSGTVVTLMSRNGGSGFNFVNTVFSDGAATSISSGTAPFTGTFRPTTPLSAVNGEPLAGAWKLKIVDEAAGDVATLGSWGLDYVPSVPRVCSTAGPSVRISPPAPTAENAGTLDVPVTLLSPDAAPHTVTFTPTAGTAAAPADFDASPITVTWNVGDPATKHLSIPLVDDGVIEGDQTFTVAATSSSIPVSAGVTATIVDPQPVIGVATPSAVTEGGGALSFPVTLASPVAGGTNTVHVATSNGTATAGSDYTAVSQTLTWNPGDPATKQVLVPVLDDTAHEAAETVHLTLDTPTGVPVAAVLGTSAVDGTINDNDVAAPLVAQVKPTLTLAKAKTKEGDKGKHAMTFTVTLSAASASAVSLQWETADNKAKAPGDYKSASGTVVIPAGATSGRFKVKIVGDKLKELNEKLEILTSALTGATYAGKATTTGQILNDD